MKKITIVDFAGGNLNVLKKKLSDLGFDVDFSNNPLEISKASCLLIPGVGHFESAMNNLKKKNLVDILNEKVLGDKIPVIGICLGMQLFSKFSEEGNCNGLGWIDASTRLFRFNNPSVKVPNIGWKSLINKSENTFYSDEDVSQKYYFVHSYHVVCEFKGDILSETEYGGELFCSSLRHENMIGFQFHPEKSHKKGIQLLVKAINEQFDRYGV